MKKILFFLLFVSSFSFAQSNAEIIEIIKNNHQYFEGKKNEKNDVKVKFDSVYSPIKDEYLVEGIAEIDNEISKFSGKISFNAKQTKKLRDPSISNFDVVLNGEKTSDNSKVFNGSLNIKMIPKLFNVIVFEGIYQEENAKSPMYFHNSNEIMRYLESLKK
ncbi:hypothetical protein [Kaistella montana]|uniref:Lipid/polyisoprenoid-binding YceI-like domain-containing protein n=1 Tax=Kaistella montana TaxID=1849733 RepID=A0ABW5K887_9FLAO|nr:hypothetical protein [Kaistella montana]MCQ4034685.1 hypothetical protein [Kaistella montana]